MLKCHKRLPIVVASIISSATCVHAASQVDGQHALFDNACAKVAATAYAKSYTLHQAELPSWKRLCSIHPDASVCRETIGVVESLHGVSSLKCGSHLSDSQFAVFDEACAQLAAAYYARTETQDQLRTQGWVKTCSAHPEKFVCDSTSGTIAGLRGGNYASVLKCGGGNQ
jgi:hypothetical protein